MIFPIVQLEKNPPKTQKKETEREKETFPPAPLYKEKEKEKERKRQRRGEEKKKKSRRLKKQGFFIYIKLPKRLGETPEAFGPNSRSVWAKHPKRLGETPGGSFLMCNIGGIEMPLLLTASCPLLGIEGDSKSKKDNL